MRHAPDLGHHLTATLRDIVALVLPAYPDLDGPVRGAVEHDVTAYVAAQIQSMPGFLRLPYKLALLGFECLPVARYGRPFRALPRDKQTSYLARWNDAPLLSMCDFVKLIRSSALLVYFDHPLVMDRLEAQRIGIPTAPQKAANE